MCTHAPIPMHAASSHFLAPLCLHLLCPPYGLLPPCLHHPCCRLTQARFKYPPHWVSVSELYDAMAAVDKDTGLPRGFMRLSQRATLESVAFSLDISSAHWQEADDYMRVEAPTLLQVRSSIAVCALSCGVTHTCWETASSHRLISWERRAHTLPPLLCAWPCR